MLTMNNKETDDEYIADQAAQFDSCKDKLLRHYDSRFALFEDGEFPRTDFQIVEAIARKIKKDGSGVNILDEIRQHKYMWEHERLPRKHFEERREALREGLEKAFAECDFTIADLSFFDENMRYSFLIKKRTGRVRDLLLSRVQEPNNPSVVQLTWLEQDFFVCGENLFIQSVTDAKRRMGLTE
jgi:hypothetical protein